MSVCPHCSSKRTRSYVAIHNSKRSKLSEQVKPPNFSILLPVVVGFVVGGLVEQVVDASFLFVFVLVAAFLLFRSYKKYDKHYRIWQSTWYCSTCGRSFYER